MAQKRVIITGAAGFIGYRLAETLHAEGVEVLSVDRLGHFDSRSEHGGAPHGERIDRDRFFDFWDRERPHVDGVFHLGACTDTTELDEAYLDRVNTGYSKEIWKRCARESIPLVYASSAATYGDGSLGYDDDESKTASLRPLNPYGESKRLFDLWALEEEKKGHAPPSWSGFKFFNVYGFGERHKGKMASVVLHAFDQIQRGERVKLFKSHRAGIADGEQKRDFVFVEDLVEVLQFAFQKPIRRGIYNLGTGRARSFLDLTNAVYAALGTPPQIEFIDTPLELRERYQYFTEATMGKLAAQGYKKPFTSLEEGVKKTVTRLQSLHS